jgi:hypothetical protein
MERTFITLGIKQLDISLHPAIKMLQGSITTVQHKMWLRNSQVFALRNSAQYKYSTI